MFTDDGVRVWGLLSWHGLNEIPPTKSQAKFQTYPLQTYMCFSPLTFALATNVLLLIGPGLKPTIQKF